MKIIHDKGSQGKRGDTKNRDSQKQPIDGGYRAIPAISLVRAVLLLDELSLRVFCALHEISERWCLLARQYKRKHRKPMRPCEDAFSYQDVYELVGATSESQQKRVRRALRRLSELKIANYQPGECCLLPVTWPERAEPEVQQAFYRIPVTHRGGKKKVPRRALRWLAREGTKAKVAVVFGAAIRVIQGRGREFTARGRLPQKWLARVFEVSERQVKHAKAVLRQLGWLQDGQIHGLNKTLYGAEVYVNLNWRGGQIPPPVVGEFQCRPAGGGQIPPPWGSKTAPSSRHPSPSSPSEKKPITSCRKVGASPARGPEEEAPKGNRAESAAPPTESAADPKPESRPPGPFPHIRAGDLGSAGNLKSLLDLAVKCRAVDPSERQRVEFYSAGAHVHRVGAENKPGLLRATLTHPERLTIEDERRGSEIRKEAEFGQKPHRAATRVPEPVIPPDSRTYLRVVEVHRQHRVAGNPKKTAIEKLGWDDDRWQRAARGWFEYRERLARRGDAAPIGDVIGRLLEPLEPDTGVPVLALPDGRETEEEKKETA